MPVNYVFWRIKTCVNPTTPGIVGPLFHKRQLKLQIFPVAVESDVKHQFLFGDLRGESKAVRRRAPVRLSNLHPMPRLISVKQKLLQILALDLRRHISQEPPCDEQLQESMDVRMLFEQAPNRTS